MKAKNQTIVTTSMVQKVNTSSGIAVFDGNYPKNDWEVTSLDGYIGKVVHRTIFGQNNYGKLTFAIMQWLPDSDMLFNSIVGYFRIKYNQQLLLREPDCCHSVLPF
jgi:hypothetical protein